MIRVVVVVVISVLSFSLYANPCESVNFHYVEAMEPQGFLGLETPELYPDFTVGNAFFREIRISHHEDLLGPVRPSAYSSPHEAWGRIPPSRHYWHPEERMKLWELCKIANEQGKTDLSIVCKGDSKGPNLIKAECFISTRVEGDDYDEYLEQIWGRPWSSSSNTRNRYDELQTVSARKDLYGVAMRRAIDDIVYQEQNPPSEEELNLLRNIQFLSELHGSNDLVISPELAECMGRLPFEAFKKYAQWDKKRFPNRAVGSRTNEEIIETLFFFLFAVIPFF